MVRFLFDAMKNLPNNLKNLELKLSDNNITENPDNTKFL